MVKVKFKSNPLLEPSGAKFDRTAAFSQIKKKRKRPDPKTLNKMSKGFKKTLKRTRKTVTIRFSKNKSMRISPESHKYLQEHQDKEFFQEDGMEISDILETFQEDLRNAHVLYAVSTNLKQDQLINGKRNYKIGKAEDALCRMRDYSHKYGRKVLPNGFKDDCAGVKLHFLRIYDKGRASEVKRNIKISEDELIKYFNSKGKYSIQNRGSEVFNLTNFELLKGFYNNNVVLSTQTPGSISQQRSPFCTECPNECKN